MELETLFTQRLILKKLTADDLKFIFASYSPNEVKQLLGFVSDEEYLKEKQKSDIGHTSHHRSICQFIFIDKESGKTIGRGGFHNWFVLHHRSEIGYLISDLAFRQKGLMSEALKAMIDYGFSAMKLHRIEAFTADDNFASIRLLEKNGFIKEALLREHYLLDGKFIDSLMFSKLSTEHTFL
ncbi:MAG: GNAT family N-acetyltransferase [Bacteroidia bacterium]|nr:GNAT family N-acetyltransferase [Bacteroidia bacterium]